MAPCPGDHVEIGGRDMQFGKQLQTMRDRCVPIRAHCPDCPNSNDLMEKQDWPALRIKLETEGFLFLRKVIPSECAAAVRDALLKQAALDGSVVHDADTSPTDGRVATRCESTFV